MVSAFNSLSTSPHIIPYRNSMAINQQGGHIQGIQPIRYDSHDYVILTGSSSTISYYAVVRLDQQPQVLSVDTLLVKPYKHAGGFQINDGLMAIGVEDNEAKNSSKVLVYEISDPENLPGEPVQMIERDGTPERSTAGCVAIARYQHQIILLVGDWDTRHLDIYTIPEEAISYPDASFQLIQSITLEDHPRTHWISEPWLAYQNINLLVSEGDLYLMGLGVNARRENVADLFSVITTPELSLTKIASRTFPATEQHSFVWGAGVDWQAETKRMRILSTSRTMADAPLITEYHY